MYEEFQQQEQAGWDERTQSYEGTTALATVQAIPHLLGAIIARPGASVLDVCCGPGYGAGAAHAMGMHAHG